MKSRWDAGQYKLKGKKEARLSCRCCTVYDKREEYENRVIDEEILSTLQEVSCRQTYKCQEDHREAE